MLSGEVKYLFNREDDYRRKGPTNFEHKKSLTNFRPFLEYLPIFHAEKSLSANTPAPASTLTAVIYLHTCTGWHEMIAPT